MHLDKKVDSKDRAIMEISKQKVILFNFSY